METDVGNYILALQQLTPKETVAAQTNEPVPTPAASPSWFDSTALVTYGPFFLFFAVFLSALGLQLMHRVRDMRTIATSLVIALLVGATPLVINQLNNYGTRSETRAGPDEVPRVVKVFRSSKNTVTITWSTGAVKTGAVRFGPVPLSEKTSRVIPADTGAAMTTHTVVIDPVKNNTVYEFEVLSGTAWYNLNGKPLRVPIATLDSGNQ